MGVLQVYELRGEALFSRNAALRCLSCPIEVAEINSDRICKLARDMLETLYNSPAGVGLAAPQVGMLVRLIVIDIKRNGNNPLVLVNPQISDCSENKVLSSESCISVPGVKGIVERHETIAIDYLSLCGKPEHLECKGFLSKVIQHEIDHLDGVLYIDRIERDCIEIDEGYAHALALKAEERILNHVCK